MDLSEQTITIPKTAQYSDTQKGTPEKPLKVYIAGKVSGEPYAFTLSKFGIAEQKLRTAGYEVFNPMTHVQPDADWKAAMKICLPALLDCDRLVALPCWQSSKGATIEVELAIKAGIPIIVSK